MARILEDEISGDPLVRVYSGMDDAALLTSLNTADRSRNRVTMTGLEVKAQVNVAEYTALTDAKKQQFIDLTQPTDGGGLDLFGTDRDILIDIFGGGSTTVANLATARVELISRGVEIGWGVAKEKDLRMHTISRATPS